MVSCEFFCFMMNYWRMIFKSVVKSSWSFLVERLKAWNIRIKVLYIYIKFRAIIYSLRNLQQTASISLWWRHNGRDGLTIVYSTVYSAADQRKHQSSASLAFVRGIRQGPVNSPHKGPVTRKMFPFDDVIMSHTHPRRKFIKNGSPPLASFVLRFSGYISKDGLRTCVFRLWMSIIKSFSHVGVHDKHLIMH